MKKGMFAGEALSTIMNYAEDKFSAEESIIKTDGLCVEIPEEVQKTIDENRADFINWDGLPKGVFEILT